MKDDLEFNNRLRLYWGLPNALREVSDTIKKFFNINFEKYYIKKKTNLNKVQK